jgi:hypothetical protein
MNERVAYDLPAKERAAISRALVENDQGFNLTIEDHGIAKRGDRWYVPIKPNNYPEKMFDYYGALARAEIEVRDQGFDIQLTPSVKQRMLVVYEFLGEKPEGVPHEVALKSHDGDEYQDLERRFPSSKGIGSVLYEGYPYDSDQDLSEVKEEVRRLHPNAQLIED